MPLPKSNDLKRPYVDLLRTDPTEWGTLGRLAVQAAPICNVLEPPKGLVFTEGGDSCVAADTYIGDWMETPSHGWTYRLRDTPGRTAVQFHVGNWDKDTMACPLPGESWTYGNDGRLMVTNSKKAFRQWLSAVALAAGYAPPDFDNLTAASMPPEIVVCIRWA